MSTPASTQSRRRPGIRTRFRRLATLVALTTLMAGRSGEAAAAAISSPSALADLPAWTLDFEDLADFAGKQFGFGVGQPYAGPPLEASMDSAPVVDADAGIGSRSGHVALRSTTVSTGGNTNILGVRFSRAQLAVGFFYRDLAATQIVITAFNRSGTPLESTTLAGGSGYAGFRRATPDIGRVLIEARHTTTQAAFDSRAFLDDLTFTSSAEARCGNAVVDPGEECDDGPEPGATCCDASCRIRPAAAICREAATGCDLPETCDGLGAACPADQGLPDGSRCGGSDPCAGAGQCVAGQCAAGSPLPVGTSCTRDGAAGVCDRDGRCVTATCGNGSVEIGEQCDGGECCTADCTLKGPTEPCGRETRACHQQQLCNGRESACPTVERFASENSTCSDGDPCTDVDTCHEGRCLPGTPICAAEVLPRGNATRDVRLKVVCHSSQAASCDAEAVLAPAEAIALRGRAQACDAVSAPPPGTSITKVAERHKSAKRKGQALPFRRVTTLRLNSTGRRLIACQDLTVQPLVTITRSDGKQLVPRLVNLLQILRARR